MSKILVVEDTGSLREVLSAVLSAEGYSVDSCGSVEAATEELKSKTFDLILCDLKLPNKSGIDLLREIRERDSELCAHRLTPFVVMTAFGTVDIAVDAMKLGATDFIRKPFNPTALCSLLGQVLSHNRIINREEIPVARRRMVTQNKRVEETLRLARRVAPLATTVLILGESGTGKELLARYVHEHSKRAENPFVPINCGSVPHELLESEFFGHEAGAFTGATERRVGLFEVAHDGTIFLDEIGTMPHALQVKLLRVLQEGEIRRVGGSKTIRVNTRVISATNADLSELIRKGSFREDLFYRLGVFILELPPLRERREDIALIAQHLVEALAGELGREIPKLTAESVKRLERYAWPGNVRELENVLHRAMVFSSGPITPDLLMLDDSNSEKEMRPLMAVAAEASKKAEIEAISDALVRTGGNKLRAARLLEVSYKTLLNKIREHGLGAASQSEEVADEGAIDEI